MSIRKLAEILFLLLGITFLLYFMFRPMSTLGADGTNRYALLEGKILYLIPSLTFLVYFVVYHFWGTKMASDQLTTLHILSAIIFVCLTIFIIPNIAPYPRRFISINTVSLFRPPLQVAVAGLVLTLLILLINLASGIHGRTSSYVTGGA